ncbi:MAG: Rpn family recombination-promoting nuclease/putative transposase [Arsenophonus sp. NC-TX2-MAG3]
MIAWCLIHYSMSAIKQNIEQGNNSLPVIIPLMFYYGTISPYLYNSQ